LKGQRTNYETDLSNSIYTFYNDKLMPHYCYFSQCFDADGWAVDQ